MAKSIKFKNNTYLNTIGVLKIFYEYNVGVDTSFSKTTNDYEIIPFNYLICGSKGTRHSLSRANGRFTVLETGTYRITFSGYINGKGNAGQRYITIFKNGTSEINMIRANMGDRTPFSFQYIGNYNKNDIFDIRIQGLVNDDVWSKSTLIIERIE